jgi:hypothetical protein
MRLGYSGLEGYSRLEGVFRPDAYAGRSGLMLEKAATACTTHIYAIPIERRKMVREAIEESKKRYVQENLRNTNRNRRHSQDKERHK